MRLAEAVARNRWPALLGVLLASLLCRLPSLFDPPWVNDEGTYFAVAQALAHGYHLYDGVWENKPPALYLVYSAVYHPFGASLFAIRVLTAATVLAIVCASWQLSNRFVGAVWAPGIALLAGLLFGVPFLEGTTGNAEVFVALFAALAVYVAIARGRPFAGGLLIGVAALFKVIGLMDGAAIALWLLMCGPSAIATSSVDIDLRRRAALSMVGGVALVVGMACVVAALFGVLGGMLRDALLYDLGYVGNANGGGVPWQLGIKVLCAILLVVLITRRPSFPVIWLVFALFGAAVSGRMFGHYLLQPIIPCVLCLALAVRDRPTIARVAVPLQIAVFILAAAVCAMTGWALTATGNGSILAERLQYYANVIRRASGMESAVVYRNQIDNHVSRNEVISRYIRRLERGQLLVWGNAPWIYVLSGRLPATPFTSALRIPQVPGETAALRSSLTRHSPSVIVVIEPARPSMGRAEEAIDRGYGEARHVPGAEIFVRDTRRR